MPFRIPLILAPHSPPHTFIGSPPQGRKGRFQLTFVNVAMRGIQLRQLGAVLMIVGFLAVEAQAQTSISYLQGNYAVPQTPQSVVNVAFAGAQTAGSLNVVVIGWDDATSQVVSVTDNRGNTYLPALATTVQPGVQSQVIYYAANIVAAPSNTVTVTFTGAVPYPDVRIAEYRGIDTAAPLDVAKGASGTGTAADSGSVSTTVASTLLVGASYVSSVTTAAGSGFTSRMITSPNGSILEDSVVSAVGSYSATATTGGGNWIMLMAAFRAGGGGSPGDIQAPTAPGSPSASAASSTQINLAWTAANDNVGVTGYRIERCQGTGCSAFAEVGTSAGLSFNSTGLTASTAYTFRIRATDAAGNLGPYSTTVSTATLAGSDTQAPTAPTAPSAAATSSSQIHLGWTASSDNVGVTSYRVERCQGNNCNNFVQVGTPTSTSYDDTGLAAAKTYRYRIRATDAAGNLGPYSAIVAATTPDTQAPTAPSGLSATPASTSRINLAWSAATDDVAVTGYRVERCQGTGCTNFAQITTTTTQLTYANTGLTTGTAYSYRVRAVDAAGNLSAYSAIASATTLDTQAPTAPTAPSATALSGTSVRVTWTASTDNVGVTGYRIERCQGTGCTTFLQVATSTNSPLDDTALAPSTTYSYRVRATDAAGNLGAYSTIATATTLAGPDTQSPTAPGNPTSTAISSTQISLAWAAATDNVGVTSYLIERCEGATCTNFIEIGLSTTTSYSNSGLVASAAYRYRIRAADAAGNRGPYSAIVTVSTQSPPLLSITKPAQGASIVGGIVAISYQVSGDQTEVNHVHFQLDGGAVLMDLTLDGSYQLTNVTPGSHVLTGVLVRVDHSPIPGSDAVPVNFSTSLDTQPPSAPGSLSASATSNSRISLTWVAATDDATVSGYRVERCQGDGCTNFVEVNVVTALNFADAGLVAATGYTYRVRAEDTSGNRGPYSATASATTLNTTTEPISYVQGSYAVPQTPQSVVTVAFPNPQTAGSLNVVAIGWNDATSQVVSVTDTRGNNYASALSPTVQLGVQSHVIYYAFNPISGSNSVTVTFGNAVSYPDVRIAEYRGIDSLIPVNVATGASGFGTTSSAGPVTTSSPNALLVGANYVQSATSGPGSGFTSRMVTSPNGSILEDRIVTSTGSYSAAASTQGGGWVMQLVVFRGGPAGGGTPDTQPPSAPGSSSASAISSSQIDVSWTPATDNVGIAGYRVERCLGTGCSNFTEIGVSTSLNFSSTGLAASTSYTFRVRAADAAGNLGPYTVPVSATTSAPTPASISIFLPASSSTVSGNATFGATVTGPIVGMQFLVDNVNVGPVVVPGSTTSVNTARFANGSHAIGAYAWDSQRNFVQAVPINVSFSNGTPANPSQTGLWSEVFNTSLVSINLTLMGNGRVLMYDKLNAGNPNPQVWDPLTNSFLSVPLTDGTNLFCSAQALLPDGRVLVAGGHLSDDIGLPTGRIFDPISNTWSATPDMAVGRWYPSLTTLPNGKVLVLSGEVGGMGDFARIPEVYDPVTNTWSQLPLASLAIPYYPHAFVLPNGKVAVTGTAEAAVPARVLDTATQTWTTIDPQLFDQYSSAMYLPGKVLKTGKSTDSFGAYPALTNAYVIDFTATSPQWRQVASMAFPRAYHVETLLPDGSVLVTGGGRTTGDYDIPNAVYAAEIWNPTTETWTTMSSMQKPRLYHGSALLLPDGRVLVSGGGRSPGPDPRDQQSLEIFAPPYLFKGPRPVISSAPAALAYNQMFTVQTPDAASISKVALVALGNMTHGINMSQRYIPLAFSATVDGLSVMAPLDQNLAPPGFYMLFVINTQGVPSIASFVKF